jgi:hypothetical protein
VRFAKTVKQLEEFAENVDWDSEYGCEWGEDETEGGMGKGRG